jgi:hypothetical protein
MAENGGEISVGERLRRIEDRLSEIEQRMDQRLTRHRENNELAIEKLGASVIQRVGEHEGRLKVLEHHDTADEAVRKYRRWLIGVGIVGVGGLIVNAIMLIQVLGKVG